MREGQRWGLDKNALEDSFQIMLFTTDHSGICYKGLDYQTSSVFEVGT